MEDKIITLATLSFEKAQLIKTLLGNVDVECFLENINLVQGAVSTGVKVNIKEVDFQKALVIFDAIHASEFDTNKVKVEATEGIKVLVPVDFSEYSQNAVDIAFDWVAKSRGELVLFNAYYSPMNTGLPFSDAYVYDVNSDDLSFEMKEMAEKRLRLMKEELEKRIVNQGIHSINVSTEIRRGIAEHEILAFSEHYNPSLIVMGTRGADKKAVDLIGSVTAEIIEGAKVPVLAVPECFKYEGLDKINSIGYLSVFGESDFGSIQKLSTIIKALDVVVKCAHITGSDKVAVNRVKMDGLVDHFEHNKIGKELDFRLIENEDFWVGVESFVLSDQIDILAFTTFKRSLISRLLNPSIAKKMLFHSTTPLLVFHS
ncbi:universal stress protein [Saccharicrinis fermentans]|uniref:Universal stress protein family protein n=1 Tax=Saccharicrinis fermentans DSM 9555 = JCM 21142 TaxID=869213 RepID=W7Y5S1_9BACT|nr:universal stress protein [Saccharicrinis fermentans]GAF03492.1 universal stress protein family protein [Saccharicrinis fermentans DSM 9555 = JCM 21142]